MANKTTVIEFKLAAKDEASGVFQRAGSELQRLAKFGGAGTDPYDLKPLREKRGEFESAVRKDMADRFRAIRAAQREEQVRAAADSSFYDTFFGPPKPAELNAFAKPIHDRVEAEAGILEKLKGAFGRGSVLKEGLEIIEGGGVIAGMTIGANLLGEWAKSAAETRDALEEGRIGFGEFSERMLQALPIFGTFRQAGLAIRELFTGEEAETRRIAEEAQRITDLVDHQRGAIVEAKKADEEHLAVLRKMREELELMGLKSPAAKELKSSEFAQADFATERRKQAADEVAKYEKDSEAKKARDAADAEVKAKREALAKAQAGTVAVSGGTGGRGILVVDPEAVAEAQRQLNAAITQQKNADKAYLDGKKAIGDRAEEEVTEKTKVEAAKRRQVYTDALKQLAAGFQAGFAGAKQFAGDFAGAAVKTAGEYAQAQQDAEKTLMDARLASLDAQAKAGDKAAEAEAARLRTAEEFNRRQVELKEILEDQKTTEEQKARAQEELDRLPDVQAKAEAMAAGKLTAPKLPTVTTATAVDSRFVTGDLSKPTADPIQQKIATTADKQARTLETHTNLFNVLIQVARDTYREIQRGNTGGGTSGLQPFGQ